MIFEQACAKINLYLHVVGKRNDGYHLLDSLFAFADKGDVIGIEPAEKFSLTFSGTYGDFLTADKNNSVVIAAQKMCEALDETLNFHLHLEKNMPVASGIGGGSADASATMRLIMRFFQKQLPEDVLESLALTIGADVPACLYQKAVFVSGIGEKVTVAPDVPALPLLLINPNKPLSTPAVFKARKSGFSEKNPMKKSDFSNNGFINALKKRHNDLTDSAISLCPEIKEILSVFSNEKNCLFSTMSGSGATCIGLFDSIAERDDFFQKTKKNHPNWWFMSALLK